MTDFKKTKSKTSEHTALKKLFTEFDGIVSKGGKCTCTDKEVEAFKKVKAI